MSSTPHGWPLHEPAGRIAYVNGRYLPHARAAVHIEDRGLQFADAIYEVVGVVGGQFLDEEEHIDRLERSVGEIGMAMPMGRTALRLITREMARRNRVRDGLIYFQVTRGAARRDHAVSDSPPRPTLIVTARNLDPHQTEQRREQGIAVITRPDERWARCDIKSTALLPNVLAKTAARKAGAFEAWLVDKDGFVTEGASTSAWIVTKEGRVVTRDLSNAILPGVTRRIILEAAAEGQIPVEERKFTRDEALAASEAFITAATLGATPVVAIDGHTIGDGKPGPIGRRIQELYRHAAEASAPAKPSAL
ncbi:MAG TPA: D-amino-acid transaminase [Rhizomicrobium sp.]|jgi:D-alanine transaminase|nr:D-amino-acid transaminase [Rhizomicrobium sp.]